jgi:hypothetical protein
VEVITVDGTPGRAALQPTAGSYAAAKALPAPRCFVLARPKTTMGMTETPCDQPHSAEYLGAVRAAFGALPKDDASTTPFVKACHDELAAQMGVAAASVDNKWGYDEYPAPDVWPVGVTVMQCYFVLWNQKKITRSVLGSKGTGIPSSW